LIECSKAKSFLASGELQPLDVAVFLMHTATKCSQQLACAKNIVPHVSSSQLQIPRTTCDHFLRWIFTKDFSVVIGVWGPEVKGLALSIESPCRIIFMDFVNQHCMLSLTALENLFISYLIPVTSVPTAQKHLLLPGINHPSCQHQNSEWRLINGGPKNVALCFCPYLRQLLIDSQNSFSGTLCRQCAITQLLHIPPQHKCIHTTLWNIDEICIHNDNNKHFGKIFKKQLHINIAVNGAHDTKLCGSNIV